MTHTPSRNKPSLFSFAAVGLCLRAVFAVLLAWLPVSRMYGLPVDPDAAAVRARHFLRAAGTRAKSLQPAVLVSSSAATYLFAAGTDRFVLAAADDDLPAVLAYGTAAEGEMPPGLKDLISAYDRLQRLTPNIAKRSAAEATEAVAPMLTTTRSQKDPYNRYCPRYTSADGTPSEARCVVGCVATALEQILTYHRRVYTLQDTLKGWTTDHYTIPDVMPGESVDTRGIASSYSTSATDAETDAVARLSYWMGMAVHMNWGLAESGATSARAREPLQRVFGMPYAVYVDSYKYSPADWHQMLRAELRAGRPIYYAAAIQRLGGHAFVIDGIDEAGYYHVNWGYSGHYDGYFDLAVLNFSEPLYDTTPWGWQNGFFCNQEALFLSPNQVSASLPDTLTRTGEEIVVTSWSLGATPMMTAYTPLTLTLRNTADHALTTPFELFTNLESDTALFSQGDYVALTGLTLEAGEERTISVDMRFDADGTRWLRLTPDLVHYQTLGLINIAPYAPDALSFATPVPSFPADSTVTFHQRITNGPDAARAGRYVTYELLPQPSADGDEGTRHGHYFYLASGATMTDTVTFRGLTPGTTYRLLVRCPWTVQADTTFTLPAASGIVRPAAAAADTWHTLDGRRIARPHAPGIYIRSGKKVVVTDAKN